MLQRYICFVSNGAPCYFDVESHDTAERLVNWLITQTDVIPHTVFHSSYWDFTGDNTEAMNAALWVTE